jgi:hypothetical protein
MTTRTDFAQPQQGLLGAARNMKTYGRRVTMATGDLTTGNVVEAFIVPAGFTVTGIIAVATDMDSNGSPTLALSVGDSGSSVRFLSSSTIGQAGTSTTTLASTGLLYAYTADTKILVTATTGSATAVAGTVDLYLQGFVAG